MLGLGEEKVERSRGCRSTWVPPPSRTSLASLANLASLNLRGEGSGAVTQVEMRNHTGITLIDRNDELCILYEKANVQELVYKQGEVAVNMRTSEVSPA